MRFNLGWWLALVVAGSVAGQEGQGALSGDEALAKSMKLHRAGDPAAAIEVLEPAYAIADIELSYYDGLFSTEQFLSRLYVEADRVDEGVTFLLGVLRRRVKKQEPYTYRALEDELLGLALLAKRTDVALQVADQRKAREDYAGWDVDYARIHAVRGDVKAMLAKLQSYFAYEHADSRARVLVLPEFYSLHGNVHFQRIVTEPKGQRPRPLQPFRRQAPAATPKLEDVRTAAEVFKKINKPSDARPLGEQLRASHAVLQAGLQDHQKAILAMLQEETKSLGYRVGLATYLLSLQDETVTRSVAKALKDDDLTAFPQQLFRIAYATADCDPEAARPFLMQMLEAAGAGLSLPAHVMSFDWDGLLMHVVGCAEKHYLQDLLRLATTKNAAKQERVTNLLIALQEPQLLPILMARLAASKDSELRVKHIERIGHLCLPATRKELLALQQQAAKDSEEAKAITEALKHMKAPERSFPEDAKIAIVDPKMRAIFFDNLATNRGRDISYVDPVLWATAKPADIPSLLAVRSRTLSRMSDEALSDWMSVSKLITVLRWQK